MTRAEAIFGALSRLRPSRDFAPAGLAMAYLNAGRMSEAVRVLDQALPHLDADQRANVQALRALALQLAGHRAASEQALNEAGGQPLARAMRGDPAPTPLPE